jgi:hypothetical protein
MSIVLLERQAIERRPKLVEFGPQKGTYSLHPTQRGKVTVQGIFEVVEGNSSKSSRHAPMQGTKQRKKWQDMDLNLAFSGIATVPLADNIDISAPPNTTVLDAQVTKLKFHCQ